MDIENMDIFKEKAWIKLWKDAMARIEALTIRFYVLKNQEEVLEQIAKNAEQIPEARFYKKQQVIMRVTQEITTVCAELNESDKKFQLHEWEIQKIREEITCIESKISPLILEKVKESWLLTQTVNREPS